MSDDHLARIEELRVLGVRQHNSGKPALALRTLRRALRDLDPDVAAALAARVWISIALAEWDLHSAAASEQALDEAERHARRAAEPAVDVLLHCQRGLIQLRTGALGPARKSLDAAVELLEHAQLRERANILLNRGTIGLLEGRVDAARPDLGRSASIAAEAGLAVERFKALHNLAYVEFLAGDLPRALRLMDEAGRVDADVSRGIWLLDRARVLVEAGLTHEADDTLARAAAIFRRDRLGQDLAETEVERARCALAAGDPASAREFAKTARDRFRRRGSEPARRTAELVLLQADLAAGHADGRSTRAAARLRDELAAAGLRLPAHTAGLVLAEANLLDGNPAAASAALAAVGEPGRDDPITGRLYAHYVRARVAAALGESSRATRRVRRGLAELARHQATFGSIDLRTAAAVHGRRLAALGIELAARSGRPATLFAAAERARAASARLSAVRPPVDPDAAELLTELRQAVESLRAVEHDRAAFERVLRRRRDLERRIVARSWTAAGTGRADGIASLADVRAQLARRARTLITYVHVRDQLVAVAVDHRVRLVELGAAAPVLEQIRRVRADLDVLAQPLLPGGLRGAVAASLRHSLADLDAALLAPLGGEGPLVVISTGVLGHLPWGSLPSLRGRPVEVAPSATKWLASSGARAARPLRVAALAGPDLPRARDEASAVAKVWPGAELLTEADASAAALAGVAGAATVLHVAAHGVHQPDSALFSYLRMADGPLFAHELQQLGAVPEHVVLSACEVGLATVRAGDEALGLASVLTQLGTRSVIASVARVGDEIAAQTMTGYHAALSAGQDSSAALAAALAEHELPPPFVCFGGSWRADLAAARPVP